MAEKTIEVEAESLEEAREQVKSQIPEGLSLLSEQVISDGKPKTVKAFADTTEVAFAEAQSAMPSEAKVIERKEITVPEQKVITVEAFDEQSAETQAKLKAQKQFGEAVIVKRLKLTVTGKKGFLGIGGTPNQYEAEILQQATVEITYETKAKISVKVGPPPPILMTGETRGGKQVLLIDVSRLNAVVITVTRKNDFLKLGPAPKALDYFLSERAPLIYKEIQSRKSKIAMDMLDLGNDPAKSPKAVEIYCNEHHMPDYHCIVMSEKITSKKDGMDFSLCLVLIFAAQEGEVRKIMFIDYSGIKSTLLVPR
jgi:hypothetical protein